MMPKGVAKKKVYAGIQETCSRNNAGRRAELQRNERRFSLPNKRPAAWERIYLEEGPEGFTIERRGRSRTKPNGKLPKAVEEDLLAEVQRLRAENEYLKNLQALVLEDERRQHKKRR